MRKTVTGDLWEQAGHWSNPGDCDIHCPQGIAGGASREKNRKRGSTDKERDPGSRHDEATASNK